MSKQAAKKIVQRYAKCLQAANYRYSAVYLFGSHAHGRPHLWSDIDVAIISDKLKRNKDKNRLRLWQLRRDIDLRIEPHGFTPHEFDAETSPIVREIKKHGIRVR